MTFDLDVFNTVAVSEEGKEFQVMHPHTGATGLFIRMKGTHSELVKTELRRIRNKTDQKDDDEGARFLASITLGWRSEDAQGKERPVTLGGDEYPFNKENAFRLYRDYPIVAEQATRFVFDAKNFLKG